MNIRAIQHYMYCPRRFGLLEINGDWAENISVVKANLMHEHVHDGTHNYASDKKVVLSAVTLYNDELDLYGVADCVEFVKDDDGDWIESLGGCYRAQIVEYKPSSPKDGQIRETDAIQVFAQKVCADALWHCSSKGILYYADVRRRITLPFDTEHEMYYQKLTKLLGEMQQYMEQMKIPAAPVGQKCSGCSMADVCMPKKHSFGVRKQILVEGKKT